MEQFELVTIDKYFFIFFLHLNVQQGQLEREMDRELCNSELLHYPQLLPTGNMM